MTYSKPENTQRIVQYTRNFLNNDIIKQKIELQAANIDKKGHARYVRMSL